MNETQHARDTLIGGMLLGRYRVVRELAKGGMGVLYLARVEGAVGFVKPVVVKLILPEHASDERFLRMFAREAQIVSQLRHPSVVDVLEFAEQDGAYVMVLEYVRGHHLGQWSRYLQLTGRQISTEIAIQVTIDVLDALHHAHSLSHPDGTPMHIVHRDVSPSNILLDEDGRARLVDFGVARMRGGSIDYQTQVHGFVGKLSYTAPEIFEGNEASPQSDLYSCAVVLHETLFGQNVFKGENQAETMQRALNHLPEPIASVRADVPAGLDAVLSKALAKSRADRYQTCREFSSALRELLPVSESEVHVALAALLKHDFGPHMAELLNIESLAERDEAWRRLGQPTRRPVTLGEPRVDAASPVEPTSVEATRDKRKDRMVSGRPRTSGSLSPGRGSRTPSMEAVTPIVASAVGSAEDSPHDLPTTKQRLPGMEYEVSERSVSPAPAAPPPKRSRRRESAPLVRHWALFGAVGVAALAFGVIALESDPEPPPSFRVVTTAPAASPTQVRAAEPAPIAGRGPELLPEPTGTRSEVSSQAKRRTANTATTRRPGPDPLRLTLAFREQQAKIEACFAERAKGQVTQPEIQVEFDLDASGQLKRAQVMPKAFASTPLGTCIQRVAQSTKFPKQSRAVSFTIPVRASRGP